MTETSPDSSSHIVDGQFQSDKYDWCPPGFVPLKITDPMAFGPLIAYAKERQKVDPQFSKDLLEAVMRASFDRNKNKGKP